MGLQDALDLEKRLKKTGPVSMLQQALDVEARIKPVSPGATQVSEERAALEAQDPASWIPSAAKGVYEYFSGEERETEETRTLPEFSLEAEAYVKDPAKAFKTTLGMLTSATDEGRIKIIQENYPEIKTYKDAKGNDIIEKPDGEKAVLNKPGASKNDLYKLGFETAWFLGPGKAAKIGKSGAVGKTIKAGLFEGAAEAGKEVVSEALGSEEEISPLNIGLTALTSGALEAVPGVVKARRAKKAEEQVGALKSEFAETAEAVGKAEEITAETGIELARAQKTGNLTDLERQAHLAAQEGASYKAMKFFEKQNEEVEQAVNNYLDIFGTAQAAEEASEKIVESAGKAVKLEKSQIQKMAKPYYDKALADKRLHAVTGTTDMISEKLDDISPQSPRYKALKKVEKYLTSGKKSTGTKEWFKGSKVVDSKGEPLTLYHGTTGGVEKITPGFGEPGAYFTERLMTASQYSKGVDGQIFKVNLMAKKPLSVEFSEDMVPINTDTGRTIPGRTNVEIVEYAQKNGYDSVDFYNGNYTEDARTWVVFDEDQIKILTDTDNQKGLRIKQLHQAKRDIGDMIESMQRSGSPETVRDLTQIKNQLVKDIKKANPLYEKGRLIYEEGMPFQTKIEKTTLGKIANLKQDQLQKVRKLLFDVGEKKASPETVRFAREAIKGQDPEAWNAIVRAELENRILKMAARESEEAFRIENVPGQFYRAMFGTKGRRESIYAAIDPEQRKNLRYVEHALQRAGAGRPGGSQTGNRMVFNEELAKGGFINKLVAITKPRETAREFAVSTQRIINAQAMAKVMFDPKWQPDMKKIRKYGPDSKQGRKLFEKLYEEVKDTVKAVTIAQAQIEE